MQLITAYQGKLQKLCDLEQQAVSHRRTFVTGLEALDDLLPPRKHFICGAVHEILSHPRDGLPLFFAALLARCPLSASAPGAIVWSDPRGELYPPALGSAGIDLRRLFFLKSSPADLVWAITQSLACKGVAATVASIDRLTMIEARRLQLAAENGGGVGLVFRPYHNRVSLEPYAAATRWLVSPARGEPTIQRWKVQLIHGHGGCVGQSVLLEVCRETNLVRAAVELVHRPAVPTPASASA